MPGKVSQRKLADLLNESGLDIDKNAIQRIECGSRFITDVELKYFIKVLHVSYDDLLGEGGSGYVHMSSMISDDVNKELKTLEELIYHELHSFIVKDTYTNGKNAGFRKVLALIKDIEDEKK